MKNKTYFSLWVFDCDYQDAWLILISLNKHETWTSFILESCNQIWGVERAALLWSTPGGTYPRYATVPIYLLIMELRFDAMLYSNLVNENSDAGHIICSYIWPTGNRFPSLFLSNVREPNLNAFLTVCVPLLKILKAPLCCSQII